MKPRLEAIVSNNNPEQYASIIKLKQSNKDLLQWITQETNFLNASAKMTERIYCIMHNITTPILCKFCNKPVKFRNYNFGYNMYCGAKCSTNDPDCKEKKKATNREKYGADYFLGTKECLEKTKATVQQKYGVDNVAHIAEVRERTKQTNIERYGHIAPVGNAEVRKTIQETSLKRYGVTCPMNSEKVRDQIEERTGYRYAAQNPEHIEKMKRAFVEKYGVKNASQVPEMKKKKIQNYMDRYGVPNHKQKHYTNMEYWQDKEYIITHFIKNNKIDFDKAEDFFNASDQTIRDHFTSTLNIKVSNSRVSRAETQIIDFIKTIKPNIIIEQSNRTLIKFTEHTHEGKTVDRHREVDIYLPEYKLGIEFDGIYFHSIGAADIASRPNECKKKRTNQNIKIKALSKLGIKLLIIWENEWSTDPVKQAIWKSKIASCLNKTRKIGARKCEVREISRDEEISFLNKNHLQGYVVGSSHRIGLYYNNVLKAVMTFGKPRFERDLADYELLRFATEKKHTIVGGASKLLKYFERQTNFPSILSYANKRWSNGNLYEALGFTHLRDTNPSSFFFLGSIANPKLIHWRTHKKDRMIELCSDYNSELSMETNLFNNKYRKIYDCGHMVYIKNPAL